MDGDMTNALDSRFLNSIVLRGALAKAEKDHLIVTVDRVEFHKILKYENGQTNPDPATGLAPAAW